jgi:hypothetical protein
LRRLLPSSGIWTQPPNIPRHQSLEADVVFLETRQLGDPNDSKLRFVLAVLNGKLAANPQLSADETQPDARFGDVQGMRQIAVGGTGAVIAGDSYRQDCFCSMVTTTVVH